MEVETASRRRFPSGFFRKEENLIARVRSWQVYVSQNLDYRVRRRTKLINNAEDVLERKCGMARRTVQSRDSKQWKTDGVDGMKFAKRSGEGSRLFSERRRRRKRTTIRVVEGASSRRWILAQRRASSNRVVSVARRRRRRRSLARSLAPLAGA